MSSLITLEDAVEICWEEVYQYSTVFDTMSNNEIDYFKEWLYNEFEQKSYINKYSKVDSVKRLNDLIFDINPKEIASQIELDNLKNWCNVMQVEMRLAITQLPLKEKQDE